MIAACPLNLECRLKHTIDMERNWLYIGEIVEAYTSDDYLTDGRPDVRKIDPIIFSMHDNNYWRLGELLGAPGR